MCKYDVFYVLLFLLKVLKLCSKLMGRKYKIGLDLWEPEVFDNFFCDSNFRRSHEQ